MLEVKKGAKVIVKGFTGIKLGVFTVDSADKKTITVLKKNGDEMIFDRKTGRQVNVEEGKEKYANSVMEDDGSFVAPSTRKVAKKKDAAKKTTSKAKAEPETDEDDEDDEPVKKSKKDEDDEDDEDDDDFEEVDD